MGAVGRGVEPRTEAQGSALLKNHGDSFTLYLYGRYFAFVSMLPYLVLISLFFFGACFFAVWPIAGSLEESFEIVIIPFLLAAMVIIPFLFVFLFILRWHGKRRIEGDGEGVTMVLPNHTSVFVPWSFLLAVELRFAKPRWVTVTLVSSAMRFTFSNLEVNLGRRVPLRQIYVTGFDLETIRDFLYHIHGRAPQLSWRMSQSFKDQFGITHPPLELEKMKFHESRPSR